MNSSFIHTHLMSAAITYIGYPSIHYCGKDKGCDPSGFDCSGFIVYLLCSLHIPLPETIRHCNEFFDSFGVLVHAECATPGDLIFISRDGMRPSHIGIVINKTYYIHAPGNTNSKVCISPIPTFAPKQKPGMIYCRNPIGFKRITLPNGRWKKLL